MTVTAPSPAAIVLYNQGNAQDLPGGAITVPAIVLSVGGVDGLSVSIKVFSPGGDAVLGCPVNQTGIPHSSTVAIDAPSWSWTAASGNSNS